MADTKQTSPEELAALRQETLQTLTEDRDAWRATAAPQSNVLIGERLIVVDRHDRGYSSFVYEGKQREGLTQVPRDMHGVIKFDAEGAARVRARLEGEAPDFGPFVVWDFQEYARSQADRSQQLIDNISALAEKAAATSEQYKDLLFALQDAWAVVHSKGDAGMKETWGRLLRENGEFAEQPAGPSAEMNARLYAALDGAKALVSESWTSQSLRDKVDRALTQHAELRGVAAGPEAGFLLLEITNTANAAFVDVGRDEEVARIIRETSEYTWPSDLSSIKRTLYDLNGNRVGALTHVARVPLGEPDEGAVRLLIKSDAVSPDADAGIALARVLKDVASKVARGEHSFAVRGDNGREIASFELREPPSYVKDGVLNIAEALKSGDVYMADEGFSGLAEGEFRYVVPGPEFTPGYHQGSGEAWLVSAKGEIAPGYEDMRIVREVDFKKLTREESAALSAVIEGRVSFEEHERSFGGGDDVEPD